MRLTWCLPLLGVSGLSSLLVTLLKCKPLACEPLFDSVVTERVFVLVFQPFLNPLSTVCRRRPDVVFGSLLSGLWHDVP